MSAGELEFVAVNPVAIMVPALSEHISGSFGLLEHLLDGSMKTVPNIPLNIVDVRDVADLHILAMTRPEANGQRFIATADGQISLPEIAALLRKARSQVARNVSAKKLPDGIIQMTALFNRQAREAALLLKFNRNVSNAKAKNILGWTPVANQEEAVLAAIDSMIKYGLIK